MHSIWHNVEVLDPLDLSFVQVYISIYNLVRLSISLMSTVCSYCLFFSSVYFSLLCLKSGIHRCVILFMSLWLDSIDPWISGFYVKTVLF